MVSELDDVNWRKVYMAGKPRADCPPADKATVFKLITALKAIYIDLTDDRQSVDDGTGDNAQVIGSPQNDDTGDGTRDIQSPLIIK